MPQEQSAYIPKIISVEPSKIIPFHTIPGVESELFLDYLNKVYVPPIPLIRASCDLRQFGDYVNYNGHHRTCAARKVATTQKKFKPSCILLENWEDLCYLRDNPPKYKGELYQELIEGLDETFEAHQNFVWEEARKLRKFLDIARQKNISLLETGILFSTT